MKFGLLFEMERPFSDGVVDENSLVEETLEQCVLADEVGFEYLWFTEHHFLNTFSASSCPEVVYGALSWITKRIRLGFGTGRSTAYEHEGFGVDPRDSRAMWEEAIEMIPQIWLRDEFSWKGRF